MTMALPVKRIAASTFKAQCLALLDRVSEKGETYVVTKHGRPVAEIVPVRKASPPKPLRGSVTVHGDIVEPVLGDWEAER